MTYKSYLHEPFDKSKFIPVHSEFINKPRGGLFGCQGDEWINWCTSEEFRTGYYKYCVEYELTTDKIKLIHTPEDFLFLINDYAEFKLLLPQISFKKMAKDYDAIEISHRAINSCRMGIPDEVIAFLPERERVRFRNIIMMGLYSWDVPSICVFNPDKINIIKTTKL